MKKPILLVAAIAGAVLTTLKRRRAHADAALWREATSDSSH